MDNDTETPPAWQVLAGLAVAGVALLIKHKLDQQPVDRPAAGQPAGAAQSGQNQTRPSPQGRSNGASATVEWASQQYHEARVAEEKGDLAGAEARYRAIAAMYPRIQSDPSLASISLAASLYQLGVLTAARGDLAGGVNSLHRAAEVFEVVAQTAERRGADEFARRARAEVSRAHTLVRELVARSSPAAGGQGRPSDPTVHARQLAFIQQLDAERARVNLIWAQSLGHS